jgi:hypothetical protein
MRTISTAAARRGFALCAGLVAPLAASAGGAKVGLGANELQATPPCAAWVSDYALAARLRLADTPFGAGDGVYEIGPGHLRLRFTAAADAAGRIKAELLAYEMQDHFTVDSSVLFIHATVVTRTDTRATPDPNGIAATGTLQGRQVVWSTPVSGYRTDGTVDCEGSGCGFSGVPPKGTSPLHIGPGPVQFGRLVFDSPALDTLSMAETKVSHTEMPRQTAYVTFSGRRMTRQCVEK